MHSGDDDMGNALAYALEKLERDPIEVEGTGFQGDHHTTQYAVIGKYPDNERCALTLREVAMAAGYVKKGNPVADQVVENLNGLRDDLKQIQSEYDPYNREALPPETRQRRDDELLTRIYQMARTAHLFCEEAVDTVYVEAVVHPEQTGTGLMFDELAETLEERPEYAKPEKGWQP